MRKPSPFLLVALLIGTAPTVARADITKAECAAANAEAQDARRDGRLSAAREKLRRCADPACPTLVRDDCTRRLDDLDRAQPTVVFEPKDAGGRDLTAVKISVDGRPLADSVNGTALAVDPGAHTFTFEVAGQAPVTEQLVLHEGEKGRTERIVIGPVPSAPAAPVGPSQTPPAAPPPPQTEPSSRNTSLKRWVGFALGGVGIVSLGFATYYDVTALSRDHDSESAAASPRPAVQATAHTIYHQASQAQTYAIVSAAVGGALIAGGVFLVLTSRSKESTTGSSVALHVGASEWEVVGQW